MKRAEHLQWAKDRAIEIAQKDSISAWTSFISDMSKHDELKDHKAIELGMMMLMGGHMQTADDCIRFIEGFN